MLLISCHIFSAFHLHIPVNFFLCFMSAQTLEVDTGNYKGLKALYSLCETVVYKGPKVLYSLCETMVFKGPKALLYETITIYKGPKALW